MSGVLAGVDQRTQLAGHNRLELLLFRLMGRQRYGINVFKVQEVITCPPLTEIPGSNPVVRGIANMRGKTITVMDLSMSIGGPSLGDAENRSLIITEYNRTVQGFLVGSVDRIVNINWEDILPPPKGLSGGSYMTAVTQIDDELVEIIDVEKVMKEVVGGTEEISEGVIDEAVKEQVQHVLVVDDSSVARKQIKGVLDQLTVETTLCNNGKEALQQLIDWVAEGKNLKEWLSLIISDVEMPVMDGYALTTAIRKNPDLKDLHVILHSSLSGVFNQAMIEKVGANAFIAKFEPDELTRVVQDRLLEHMAE
ncbi:MAG: chemotaxis protein CheV [Gammaproteobacteria bacterium]|nr:chemotaxis protein CheV [Gammaproteobacteria bacterium]